MYWMDDRLRMALLKEKKAYRKFWNKYGAEKLIASDREIQKYYARNPDPPGSGRVGPDPNCLSTCVVHDFFMDLATNFGISFECEPR